MGGPTKVILSVALTPGDVDADFEAIKNAVKKVLENIADPGMMSFKLVPLAFGLKSLEVGFVMDESYGSEIIEQKLASIPGVQNVEIKGVSLYETKEFKPLIDEPKK